MDETILTRLYRYCAYQDRCTREITEKLLALEVAPADHSIYLDHLRAERFLDDQRYAHQFVRGKHGYKGWGRIKIQHELRRKGLPEGMIAQALAEELAPEAYHGRLWQLAINKWEQVHDQSLQARRDKTARFLSQKGYAWSEIQEVLRELPKNENP